MKKCVSLFLTVVLVLTMIGTNFAGASSGTPAVPETMFPADLLSSATKFGTYFKTTVGDIPSDAFEKVGDDYIMTVKRPSGGADTGWYLYYTKDAIEYEQYEVSYDLMIPDCSVGKNAPAYINLGSNGSGPAGENYYKFGVKDAWAVSAYTTANESSAPDEKSEIAKDATNNNLTFTNTDWINIKVAVSTGTMKLFVNGKEIVTAARTETGVLDGFFGLRYENTDWKIKNLQITDTTPVRGTKIAHVPADVLSSATKFGQYFNTTVGTISTDAFEKVGDDYIMTVKRPTGGADTGWYLYYTKDALDYDEYEISYDLMIPDCSVGKNAPAYINLAGNGAAPTGENYYKFGVKDAWAVSAYTTANEASAPDEKSEIAKNDQNQNLTFSNSEWIKVKIVVKAGTVTFSVNGKEITTANRTETGILDGCFALRYENTNWKLKNLSIVGLNETLDDEDDQDQEENKPTGESATAVAALVCASVVLLGVLVITKAKNTVTE